MNPTEILIIFFNYLTESFYVSPSFQSLLISKIRVNIPRKLIMLYILIIFFRLFNYFVYFCYFLISILIVFS